MFQITQTEYFYKWLKNLRDKKAATIIADRLLRFEKGNFGDVKPIGEGVSEARIHYGVGYRLYFIQRGNVTIIMLGGGDKSSQARDIKKAIEISKIV
jgi:putative addiction module killer protein